MAELFFTNVFTSFLIFITWTNSLRVLREVRASTDVRSRSGATASFAAICNIFVLTFWLVFRYYHRAELRGERKSAWRIELLRVSICALLFVLWSIPLPIGRREHPSCFLWPEDGNAVGPGLQSIWTMRSTITNYLATPEGECRLPRRIAGFAMINSLTCACPIASLLKRR
ncbi:hypothetical protein CALVIDRAFT_539830 [Calocera viscosa TUFC12733]|uniref:Uncharacterized protein n=1 Tax=Calocera viscosa (strain TUFC12733) TaxID=1330018 RepID=A0A167JJG2_CALVF|nr:hypothetical protein CALVIDRAFT_539830 [Calocera viscosa TUFC12733]